MNFYLEKMKTDSTFKGAYGGSITYFLYTNQNNAKTLKNNFCKDIFLTIPVVIYSKKDFYLLEAINEKIELLKSAGLINFWHYHQFIEKGILKLEKLEYPKVFTLKHFDGCFGIFMCGCAISLVVFGVECIIGKKN
jgi:hypothetical protein